MDFTKEQLQADDAQYASLAAELAEPDPELPQFSNGSESDQPTPQADERGDERQPQDEDTERQRQIAEAAALADQYQDLLEARRYEHAPAPDAQSDPLGYLQHLGTQYQQIEARNQQQAFVNAVTGSEAQMRESTPDYDDACKHLESFRMDQLQEAYPDTDPVAIIIARQHGLGSPAELRAAILNQDRIAVAQQALMRGQSPAQLYYNYAKKAGFRSGAQSIDNTRRGQRTSGNNASSGHRSSGRVMNEKQLTKLYTEDPEVFDKEWDRYAAAQR